MITQQLQGRSGPSTFTGRVSVTGDPPTATVAEEPVLFYPVLQYTPKVGDVVLLLRDAGTVWGLGSLSPTVPVRSVPVASPPLTVTVAPLPGSTTGTVFYGGALITPKRIRGARVHTDATTAAIHHSHYPDGVPIQGGELFTLSDDKNGWKRIPATHLAVLAGAGGLLLEGATTGGTIEITWED